ncbi:MAG: hypothetical protein RI885_2431 [Actinomycetota bacterium]|jgi:hypothetical protein
MIITLPFDEAIAFATLENPLPAMVTSVTCDDSTVTVVLDLKQISSESRGVRVALAVAGTVTATTTLLAFEHGVATLAITAHARGLPAHTLLQYLVDPIDRAMTRAGLPAGLVTIGGGADPEVRIDVQRAMDQRMPGVAVTALRLELGAIRIEAHVA